MALPVKALTASATTVGLLRQWVNGRGGELAKGKGKQTDGGQWASAWYGARLTSAVVKVSGSLSWLLVVPSGLTATAVTRYAVLGDRPVRGQVVVGVVTGWQSTSLHSLALAARHTESRYSAHGAPNAGAVTMILAVVRPVVCPSTVGLLRKAGG